MLRVTPVVPSAGDVEVTYGGGIETTEYEVYKLSTTVGELITEYEENLNAFTLKEIAPEKSSGSYYCPVHKWIGKCPEFPEGKDSESIQQ